MGKRWGVVLTALLFGVAGIVGAADAAFIAYICNDVACAGGAPDVVVVDQGAGDDNPVVGVITAQGVVGGLTTAVNVSQSKPAIGSEAAPQLDLNFTATGIGDVSIYASDTGFTGRVPLTFQIGGTSSSDPILITGSAAGGSGNTNQTPGALLLASLGPFTGSPFTGATGAGTVGDPVNPYALTVGVHVVQQGGTSTGDAVLVGTAASVPEPAAALLLGLGLLGLGFLARKRD